MAPGRISALSAEMVLSAWRISRTPISAKTATATHFSTSITQPKLPTIHASPSAAVTDHSASPSATPRTSGTAATQPWASARAAVASQTGPGVTNRTNSAVA
jgi:hypothetical protein